MAGHGERILPAGEARQMLPEEFHEFGVAEPDVVPKQRKLVGDTRRWLVSEMARQGRRTIPSEANHSSLAGPGVGGDLPPRLRTAFSVRPVRAGSGCRCMSGDNRTA